MGSTKEIVLRELTMSKKRRPDSRIERQPDVRTEEVAVQPRRYTPPCCSICTGLRPAGTDYVSVYTTRNEGEYFIRYCRCGFCNNTFKDIQKK